MRPVRLLALGALLCALPSLSLAQAVVAPARTVPLQSVGFGTPNGTVTMVDADHGLPMACISGCGGAGGGGKVDTVIASASVDRGGTITAGGTAQTFMAANPARRGFAVQNQSSGNLYVSCAAPATLDFHALLIPPNGPLYESSAVQAETGACSIIGATTGQAYFAREF